MNSKVYSILSLLMLVAMVLAACGPAAAPTEAPKAEAPAATEAPKPTEAPPAGPKMGGTLTLGVDQEPPTMDPHASPSAITFYITSQVGESLLYLDSDRQVKPWLAERFEPNDDATEYTFYLRDDVTFQDGTPFNAEAVKWNFDRIVDPDFSAGGALSALEGYIETEVVDEFTAKVKFEQPYMPFVTYVAGGTLAMVSPTATQEQGDLVNDTPVMSGPYKITEYVSKSHVTIERWDGYTRTPPWSEMEGPGYIDKFIWKFVPEDGTRIATVESGETQVVNKIPFNDLPRLEESEDHEVVKRGWTGTPLYWAITHTKPPTDDIRVRQAINHGINRDLLLDTIYKGIGVKPVGQMVSGMLDSPKFEGFYDYDPEKAAQLLDEAGWNVIGDDGIRMNEAGERLELSLNSIDYGGGPWEINVWTQGQLREIGMDVEVKAQARPPWYESNYGCETNGPILFLRSGDWDGLYALYHSSRVNGNFNWVCLADPEIDKMLEDGRGVTDLAAREQHYVDLQLKLMEQAYFAPLVEDLSVWAVRSEVTGLQFNGFAYPIVAEMHFVE